MSYPGEGGYARAISRLGGVRGSNRVRWNRLSFEQKRACPRPPVGRGTARPQL